MPIIVELDVMLARRKMRSKELAQRIGLNHRRSPYPERQHRCREAATDPRKSHPHHSSVSL